MRRKTQTISFRIDEELARMIDQSRSLIKSSRGEFVRGVVISHLHQTDATMITDQILELRQDVESLALAHEQGKTIQRRILFAILTVIGKLSPEDAKATIGRVFPD